MGLNPHLASLLFAISAVAGVVFAGLMVTRRNPIYSALYLVLFFITVAFDFLLLNAPFLAFMQVLVYGGAIMVLYLFVIMLINPREEDLPKKEGSAQDQILALGVSGLLLLVLTSGLSMSNINENYPGFADLPPPPPSVIPAANGGEGTREVPHGSIEALGQELFARHLFVFELTSFLILIAIVGAVHLSIRTRKAKAPREPRRKNVLPEHIQEKIRQQAERRAGHGV